MTVSDAKQMLVLDASLGMIGRQAMELFVAGGLGPSLLMLKDVTVDGMDFGCCSLDGLHPAQALEAMNPPETVAALGFVCFGNALDTVRGGVKRIGLLVLMSRSGEQVSFMHSDDDGIQDMSAEEGGGPVQDLLRKKLGVES